MSSSSYVLPCGYRKSPWFGNTTFERSNALTDNTFVEREDPINNYNLEVPVAGFPQPPILPLGRRRLGGPIRRQPHDRRVGNLYPVFPGNLPLQPRPFQPRGRF